MSAYDVVGVTRALVDIDSTTGNEAAAGRWLARTLQELGYDVTRQTVEGERENLVATLDRPPRVVFSTHIDCVPPFFPSRIDGDRLYGRGSCDAKGILAAQLGAAERLREKGERRIGLLFVVGEERGSDGAQIANTDPGGSQYLINGEPTDNRLARATRGVLRVRLRAMGRAAHSSYPHLGESAIEKLVDALVRLRAIDLPEGQGLGRTHYTVGVIHGGVAPNVVPAYAECEVLFRTVGDGAAVRSLLTPLEPLVDIEHVLEVPPVALELVDGYPTEAFPYTTDIPLLSAWGRPLLFGPGSVLVAHTDEEYVSITELRSAIDHYERLASALLAR
jgi:acetylornithine deacetylase